MKKRILLITAVGALAFATLQSDSTGPGSNYTGSRGATAGCSGSGCHSSSATTGMMLGVRLDSAGVAVTKYTPGVTYKIVISDTNTTTNSLPKFGFELSCVTGSGAAAATAGSYGALPTGTRTRTAGVLFWEHATPLTPISGTGGTNTVYADSINWTAPVAGSGTVTMFLVMNTVNFNGNADAGDKWNTKNVAFAERVSSASVANVASSATITAYPNPASNNLNLQFTNAAYGSYNVAVYDLTGKQIAVQIAEINGTSASVSVDASNWAPGLYNAVVEKDGTRQVVQVVKQ